MTLQEQNTLKFKVALSSVIAAVFLTALKLVFALYTGSLGLLSEFAHSGLDFFAALLTVFTVRYSSKPADKEHPYGHGKIENLSAIAQVFFLLATCAYIIYEGIARLFFHAEYHLVITPWAYVVMLISIAVDISRSRILKKVAVQTNSQALEADAMHFSTDIWSSSVVILGLFFVSFNISREADAIAALVVCAFIIYVSMNLARKAVGQLMDKVPEGLYDSIVENVEKIKGVEKIKLLRVRESGPKIFIDMTIYISRTLPFQKAHEIMDEVENKIRNLKSNSDITIHSEPIETETETIIDKARLIVTRNGLKCHDIFTYEIDNENYLTLDVEYTNNDNFEDAHKAISNIEREIYDEIKSIKKVQIHIDEPSELIFRSENVTAQNNTIVERIKEIISSYKDVIECKDFNIVKANNRLRISLTCTFPRTFEFSKVHRLVHKIESEIYHINDDIADVMIHAEPEETITVKHE
jgi:cation diffusion facilitator family transporter